MKKAFRLVLMIGILAAFLCMSAVAADNDATPGLCGFTVESAYGETVTLTPKDGAGNAVTAASATVDGQTVEGFYPGAEQVEVTCTGVESGAEYLVIVLNDDSNVPTEDNIVYIDQVSATSDSVTFAVYPNGLESGKTYRIYLSSDAEEGAIQDLVQIASFRYVVTDAAKEDDGGDNPGGDNPGGDNPGGDNPGGDNPGGNTGGGNTGGGNTGGGNTGGGNTGGGNTGGGTTGGGAVGGGGGAVGGGDTSTPGTGTDKAKHFEDMPGHWAEASVNFVSQRNLFQGTSETLFSPNLAMTRSMLVTVLYRLDGEKKNDVTAAFEDVAADSWYADAVAWGNATGVVKGYTETTFAPNDNITREQLAVMVYRYAQTRGFTLGDDAAELDFADAEKVGDWALEGTRWAVSNGIITGKPGNLLDPQGNASRAEVATVCERFVKLLEK